MSRLIDADALQLAIVEEGQANKRKKYIIGDIWELTGAEIREVINSQPTIQPDNGLQKLADEIAKFKRHLKSENSNYLTGYLCALSVVEGMIANMKREVTT